MSLLAPAALAFALLALPILLLYMLKLRRREVQVSSTYLWQMLLRDRQANAPWQRLRRSLLLFLQLLILAALVLALARPALRVPSLATGSVVLVLDASASMNARDAGGETRFSAARQAASQVINDLPAGSVATIILASREPRALVSAENDRAVLRQALEEAVPSQGTADWDAALALAAGAAAPLPGSSAPADVLLFSDGGLPVEGLPGLPGPLRYVPVGSSAENLAIAALALRAGPAGLELFAQAHNYGSSSRTAILSIYQDGELVQARQVTLAAGQDHNLVLPGLPDQPARWEARLSPPGGEGNQPLDALPLDDAGFAVYRPPAAGRTLLVTTGNLFLEQVLAAMPGVQAFRALQTGEEALEIPTGPFDLYVFDGLLPTELPQESLLLVNPPENELFPVTGVFSDTAPAEVAGLPLVQYVDWQDVHIRQAKAIEPPAWAQVLVSAPGGPLVFAGESSGRQVAVITFDLHDSDLPLKVTFPVLFSNLVGYLLQEQPVRIFSEGSPLADSLQPGEGVSIQPAGVTGPVEIISPGGEVYRRELGEGGASFTQTGELGFYQVSFPGEPERGPEFFSVNLFSAIESRIAPQAEVQTGQRAVPSVAQSAAGQREIWPWLALIALGVLLVEWWVYHRGQGLPKDWKKSFQQLFRRS